MDTILSYITTKKPYDYEDVEDVEDEVNEHSEIETKEILKDIIEEQVHNVPSNADELPLEPPKLERQQAIMPEPAKPKKVKKPLSEKKKQALEKARLARAEKATIRRLREQAEKEEKDREHQFRREAIMLEKLQPMIDDAIHKSLNAQKIAQTTKQRHPNIISREKQSIGDTPKAPERKVVIDDEEERLNLLRQALGY